MKSILRRVGDIHIASDLLSLRWVLGWSAIVMATFLLWPGQLFPTPAEIAAGTGRTTYAVMAQIMPEEAWGILYLGQGSFMLWSLVQRTRPRCGLYVDALLGASLWTITTIACFYAHFSGWGVYQPPAAMSAEVTATVGSWWHFVRYWADREVDDHGK